jgi:hypothetical protein
MVRNNILNRINKEIILLKTFCKFNKITQTFSVTEQESIFIYIYKNSVIEYNIKIEIFYDYPFHPPNVSFFNKNNQTILYYDFYKNSSDFYLKYLNIDNHICPCCFNIICNMNICNTLVDIIKDLCMYHTQFKRLREMYYFKKIINCKNNLNNDIINIIIEYL